MFNICIVDEVPSRSQRLQGVLESAGYKFYSFTQLKDFYLFLLHSRCDVVVLDASLLVPEDSAAIRVLHQVEPPIGIVAMTEPDRHDEKIRMLEWGCDACINTLISIREVSIVIESLLRRLRPERGEPPAYAESPSWHLADDAWSLNSPSGESIGLTVKERLFMQRLLAEPGEIVSREDLVCALGEDAYLYDYNGLDALVSRMRRKIAEQGLTFPLRTVRGKGYLFLPHSERTSN